LGSVSLFVLAALIPVNLQAQNKKKNPSSKVYVSDVSGDAQIDTGDNIQDLNKRSVYTAQGTIIETRKAEKEQEKGKIFSTMVYSNGTGAFFDEDTRVEVKNFVQEPFTPNRTDMDVEPSISQTQAYVPRGTVALCTSKLVAGSNMTYRTPHGGINIRGKKIVIETNDSETKVSMLEGDSTVRGGELDMGGQTLKAGQQAIIRRGAAGQANTVTVQQIPPAESAGLDDKVAMACMAKKTVYFEVKERSITSGGEPGSPEAAVADSVAAAENTASGGSTTTSSTTAFTNSDPVTANSNGPVTAFDGPVANSGFATSGTTVKVQEIVAVPVIPVLLPVDVVVSPARIVTPTPKPGG
jgi:hypothetical protein